MLRRLVPLAFLAGMVSLALVACGGDDEGTPTSTPTPTTAPTPTPTLTPTPTPGVTVSPPVTATPVTVINRDLGGSGEYAFDPAEFNFKVGETVTFELTAETELHSFTVEELDIDLDIDGSQTPGKTETLTFTFDEPGTFDLICIYHEGSGMVGTITVQ